MINYRGKRNNKNDNAENVESKQLKLFYENNTCYSPSINSYHTRAVAIYF